jgi:hypothetical protein
VFCSFMDVFFCIVGGGPLGCSYRWRVHEGSYGWRRFHKSELSYYGFGREYVVC